MTDPSEWSLVHRGGKTTKCEGVCDDHMPVCIKQKCSCKLPHLANNPNALSKIDARYINFCTNCVKVAEMKSISSFGRN